MNNFHIRIEDCTEAQRARLEQVYGQGCLHRAFVCYDGVNVYNSYIEPSFVQITPDEFFKRLGLDDSREGFDRLFAEFQSACLRASSAESRIKDLEQQLAKQPLDVDWSLIDSSIFFVNQHRRSGEIYFHGEGEFDADDWKILAVRPKPKYTEEQIQAIRDYDKWLESFEPNSADEFLKEQGQ